MGLYLVCSKYRASADSVCPFSGAPNPCVARSSCSRACRDQQRPEHFFASEQLPQYFTLARAVPQDLLFSTAMPRETFFLFEVSAFRRNTRCSPRALFHSTLCSFSSLPTVDCRCNLFTGIVLCNHQERLVQPSWWVP